MRRTMPRAWALLPFALSACASTGRASYDTISSELSRADARAASAQVRAQDQRALRGDRLRRGALVRAVLDRNPTVEAARQGVRAALARYPQAGSWDDPRVTLSAAPLSVASPDVSFGWSAGISQAVPFPGKLGSEKAVAAAETEAERGEYEAVRLKLALAATLLFDEYYVAERAIAINGEHRALLATLRESALAQYAAGRASAQDAAQAEVERVRLEQERVVLATNRRVTAAQLNELLHRAPDAPLPPPPDKLEIERPPEAAALALSSEATANRPEIAAARARVRAEGARAERARRESYPDLVVSTQYNTMWAMPEHRWMVGLGFEVPLQLGPRRGAVDQAEASRRRYAADVERLGDQARTEVAIALARASQARQVLALGEGELVPAAREQVGAARAGFVAAQNDFASVIEAERALRSAELSVEIARADLDRRIQELRRALGRVPGLGEVSR